MLVRELFVLPLLAVLATPAQAGCFRECLSHRITSADDRDAMRHAMGECRDICVAEEGDALKAAGLQQQYATCRARPLDAADFRKLRGGNAGFTVQDGVLVWEFTNVLPDKVIRAVEIGTQTMHLADAVFSIRTLIPPGRTATIVVMDFYDGYPAARFTSKLSGVAACEAR
ncbi:hypothetical protein [Ancylobacter terrae]|uniref:hypothetical protein n=1 Tax=Ancylobacter sp. sgz301288 TaxID=3342077 RepID=UPI00385D17AD